MKPAQQLTAMLYKPGKAPQKIYAADINALTSPKNCFALMGMTEPTHVYMMCSGYGYAVMAVDPFYERTGEQSWHVSEAFIALNDVYNPRLNRLPAGCVLIIEGFRY